MRQVQASSSLATRPGVQRVVALEDLASEWQPDLAFAVMVDSEADKVTVARMQAAGAANVGWIQATGLQSGDVIGPAPHPARVTVLYRESDRHHALFVTNRCNSRCLMCSQPPTTDEDGWLFQESADVVRHFRASPATLGITGGEPLLSPASLFSLVNSLQTEHPSTRLEVLTNGRLLARPDIGAMLDQLAAPVAWLVPLYGHADFLHDYIVQAPGAFDETLGGLLALREHEQPIQLRVVLIDPVINWLPELCDFIGRNLPFVEVVSLMGCEPIGYALANRDICEVDLSQRHDALRSGVQALRRRGVPHMFMNVPLCALPDDLRPKARQSISDWKNVYASECMTCAAKADCCGLFAWHERGWKPTPLKRIEPECAS